MARPSKWSEAYRKRTGRSRPDPARPARPAPVATPSDAELERMTAPAPGVSAPKPEQKRK